MAPELVQLPVQRAEEVAVLAQRMGAASIVKAMERLGEMLVEMRHAPDPRLLLEVALVQLTHEAMSVDLTVVMQRLDRIEHQLGPRDITAPIPRPVPLDPTTGRATLGGRARAAAPVRPVAPVAPVAESPAPAVAAEPAVDEPAPLAPRAVAPAVSTAAPAAPPSAPVSPALSGTGDAARAAAVWSTEVMPGLKSLPRAIYAATKLIGERDGSVVIATPNDAHRAKCLQHKADLDAAIVKAIGVTVPVVLVVDGAAANDDNVVPITKHAPPPPDDDDVDLDGLVDAPPESVQSPTDRLLQAFPGSQMIEE
jgi:DNA polymerase-3 subunit gamma/tau